MEAALMRAKTAVLYRGAVPLHTFLVQHAVTQQERERGLVGKLNLADYEALMLHVPEPDFVTITNRNVSFPICVFYLNAQGVVIDRKFFRANDPIMYGCSNTSHVIEMPESAKGFLPVTTHVRWQSS